MASSYSALSAPLAETDQDVIMEKYDEELVVIVPAWLHGNSKELFEFQKRVIELGAVTRTGVAKVQNDEHLAWISDESFIGCYHLNIPPVERENLRYEYPSLIPLCLTETSQLPAKVVAGAFAVLGGEWFRVPESQTYTLQGLAKVYEHFFRSLKSSPNMYLPLRSKIICNIHATITQLQTTSCKHTEATYVRTGGVKNFSAFGKGTTFKLGDDEQLEQFLSGRLEEIPKKMLVTITILWGRKLASRHKSGRSDEAKSHSDLIKYERRELAIIAASLLLQYKATSDDKIKLQEPWIEELQNSTKSVVEDAPDFQICDSTRQLVLKKLLPSVFHVAQLHEYLCRLTNKGEFEIIICWQHLSERTKKRIDMAKSERENDPHQKLGIECPHGDIMGVPLTSAVSMKLPSKRLAPDNSTSIGDGDEVVRYMRHVPKLKRPCVSPARTAVITQHGRFEQDLTDSTTPVYACKTSDLPQAERVAHMNSTAVTAVTAVRPGLTVASPYVQHPTVDTLPHAARQPDFTSSFNNNGTDYGNTSSTTGFEYWPYDTLFSQPALRNEERVQHSSWDQSTVPEIYTTPSPYKYFPQTDITEAMAYSYERTYHPTLLLAAGATITNRMILHLCRTSRLQPAIGPQGQHSSQTCTTDD